MTDKYELPRTEDGGIDFNDLKDAIWISTPDYVVEIMNAIDANARKEEREACADTCEKLLLHSDGTENLNKDYLFHGVEESARAIRERGEK